MLHMKIIACTIAASFLLISCGEDDPVIPQEEHFEAIGVVLSQADTVVARILRGETSDTLHARVDETGEEFTVRFFDVDENIVEAQADEVTFSWEIGNPALAEIVQESGNAGAFSFRLRGIAPGETTVEFFILHEGHADFRSGTMPLTVR